MILVNGYFRSQVVSGQQRYAREIADRLPDLVPGKCFLKVGNLIGILGFRQPCLQAAG